METTNTTAVAHPQEEVSAAEARKAQHLAIREMYSTLDGYADRMSLRFAGPIALVCGLLTWLLNWSRSPIPFLGPQTAFGVLIFFFVTAIGLLVGGAAFIMGVRYRNQIVEPAMRRSWLLPVAPLAISYALTLLLVTAIALMVANAIFQELALPWFYAALVVGMVCGAVAYNTANRMMQVSVHSVIKIFAIILFAGIAISAVKDGTHLWWRESFSFLGEMDSSGRAIFNATLVLAGVLFVVLQQFFMDQFTRLAEYGLLSPRKTKLVRGSLIAIGLSLAMVGLVPFGVNGLMDTVHSFSAYLLLGILLAHMLFAHRLLPYFSREYYAVTWFMVAALAVAVTLHFLGSINTAGIELIGFAIAGAWFMLFVKNVELLVDRTDTGKFDPANRAAR